MTTFGYVKGSMYTGDGILMLQVRVPSIHGPYDLREYGGRTPRNYVYDQDLPWYQSLLLPRQPNEGDVVAVTSLDGANRQLLVLGITGATFQSGEVNI